ncbi:MAG: putative DNA binding domain-containing protein [Acholeplasmatales bacterium]|nr:putative DNA binding domain-containing protein [Acholeplasmatales bacterium]
MQYIESETVELKSILTDETKTEVIAFLNSYLGGTIYVGVADDGTVSKLTKEQKELYESKIINWIRDESIYPNCSEYISLKFNEDNVLVVSIIPGKNKPYYLKDKGPKPSGVYIRYGRNKSQASQEEITRMIMESSNIFYEELISSNQDLTFNILRLKFEEKKMDFSEFKMITSGFMKDDKYTNLAYIFSDQFDVETKIGVYQGLDRSVFKSKKEFSGSIISQIDRTLEYYNLCNETRIIIDGSPMRKEFVSYPDKAAREAILNCYCHRDYNIRSNIKIEFFDDRCEIISPGGFYNGLTLDDALSGMQSFRNKYLVKLLHKLGYIENYSSGLNRIFKEYANGVNKPCIETSLAMFKIVLPNLNYKFKVNCTFELSGDISINVDSLPEKELIIFKYIVENGFIIRSKVEELLNIKDRRANELLKSMVNKNIIKSKREGRIIKYILIGK